ncbi:MAG: hypothetical protein DKT66_03830 [Candidatus Melainabacteria bacterium]|nr:MAG: hypothetical protein DKT66_03830 [Candidatus Melainabacteria bacterium]
MVTHLPIIQTAPAKIEVRNDLSVARERELHVNDSLRRRPRVLFVAGAQAGELYQDFLIDEMERLKLSGCVCYALLSKPGCFSKRLTQRGFYYFLDSEAEHGKASWRRNFSQSRDLCDFLSRYLFDAVVYASANDVPTVRVAAWMSGTATRIALTYDPAYCSSWAGGALESSTSNLDTQTVALSDWIAWKYQKLGRTDVKQHHLCSVNAENFDVEKFDSVASRADVLSRLGISECNKLICMFGDILPYYPRSSFFPEHLFGVLIHDSRLFVESMKTVLDKNPDAHFVLVGEQIDAHGQGYARYLIDLAQQLGVSANFHCLPESEATPHLLAAADIVVQTSHLDVSPNIVRALLMEKPVIATRRAGEPNVIEHNKTGILIPPDDVVALAEAIESLFDVQVARKLAASGRQAMLQRANLDRACVLFTQDSNSISRSSGSRALHAVRIWLGLYMIFCFKFMLRARTISAGKTDFRQNVSEKLAGLTYIWLRYFTILLKRVLH